MSEKEFSAKMHIKCKQLFIGDICYALRDDKYYGVWGKSKEEGGMYYSDGVIADKEATYAIAVGTAYGDGSYFDDYGCNYGVDAGVLGVSNMDYLREDDSTYCGFILNLPCEDIETEVSYDEGKINIVVYDDEGNLLFDRIIDTDPKEDEDEDDPWDEDEKENEDE